MKVWRMVECDCDGDRIGRTWKDTFYATEDMARRAMLELVYSRNEKESQKNRPGTDPDREWRLYRQDSVEEFHGWVNWAYTSMLYVESVEVHTL